MSRALPLVALCAGFGLFGGSVVGIASIDDRLEVAAARQAPALLPGTAQDVTSSPGWRCRDHDGREAPASGPAPSSLH